MLHSLDRFLEAQEHAYAIALAELRRGRKRTHWMWYIFPQLRGLGQSRTSYFFGIEGIDEARAYLAHPVLSVRLREVSEALLRLDHADPEAIFGTIDAQKLCSSMTLFAYISEEDSVFARVLARYYHGEWDTGTLAMLAESDV